VPTGDLQAERCHEPRLHGRASCLRELVIPE